MTTTTLSQTDLRNALALAKKIRQRNQDALAEWRAEDADMARQGYRTHYCVHGTNLWTDYDNICWGCEEYGFFGFESPYAEALREIRWQKALVQERVTAACQAITALCSVQGTHGQPKMLPVDIGQRLVKWAETGE